MLKKFIALIISIFVISAFAQIDSQSSSGQMLQRRIFMLEYALAPKTAPDVANVWANAIAQRNGAVQYMLLCPNLQKSQYHNMVQLNWVTGTSSPRVIHYKITALATDKFNIAYTWSDKMGITTQQVIIEKIKPQANSSQQWCIKKFS